MGKQGELEQRGRRKNEKGVEEGKGEGKEEGEGEEGERRRGCSKGREERKGRKLWSMTHET